MQGITATLKGSKFLKKLDYESLITSGMDLKIPLFETKSKALRK